MSGGTARLGGGGDGTGGRLVTAVMITIGEHDRVYRRRIARIIPIALAAHAILLAGFTRFQAIEKIITFGYEGPETLRPEITILNDRTPEGAVASQHRAFAVEEVFIEGLDRPENFLGREPSPRPSDRPRPMVAVPEMPEDFEFRSYPARAPVPYRLDYVILRMVKPDYPLDALAAGQEGYVLVEVYISPDGAVNEAHVRTSFGPRSFEESSLRAIRQFLFKPIREGEKSVSFWVSFLVRFELRR